MIWNRALFFICVFGFLKEFRPSDSFISPYLNGHWKNFTEYEINQKIYPVATYSNLILLVVVFLLTDWLRYKPVIILEGIAGIVTWTVLPLGHSILLMQISQFFFGFLCAAEVAYYSYLYAKVEKKNYQRATSVTKSTLLVSKASSALVSQVLIIYNLMDYHELNFLTLGAMVLGTICANFLPSVAQSTYFHRTQKNDMSKNCELEEVDETGQLKPQDPGNQIESAISNESNCCMKCLKLGNNSHSHPFEYLVKDFIDSVRNKHILKWSMWWALSLGGYLQKRFIIKDHKEKYPVINSGTEIDNYVSEKNLRNLILTLKVTYYMQLLWQNIINKDDDNQGIYHGFSTCANCLIGAICTYLVGFLKLKWDVYGEIVLAFCSLLQGSILLYSAHISHLLTGYFLYMTFRVLYQTSSTIASAEIARHIKAESYALVFGMSTFVALLGQTCLTVVVIDLLKLHIRNQFIVYGNYYIATGVGFFISGVLTLMRYNSKHKSVVEANEVT